MTKRADLGEWGPAMRALSPRWQAFVAAYLDETFRNPRKDNHGAQAAAARRAGFGGAKTKPITLAQIGWKLMHDDRIIAAVAEESRKILRNGAPEAVKAVMEGVRNPDSKHHAKFVGMVLDRADPVQTTHTVMVERSPATVVIASEKILARIAELTAKLGLEPVKQIEATPAPEVEVL